MINWNIETRNISDLQFNPRNPRTFTKKGLEDLKKSIKKCGDANIITINKDNMVLGGHARLTVMKELGITEVTVKVPDRLLTPQECDEITIRLNANQAGEWDYEILQAEYETDDLINWGLDVDILDEVTEELLENENEENIYTKKITIPEYTPKGSKPAISELYNHDKYDKLIDEIDKTPIPEELKDFLKIAATRHISFNFKNIAEYYCHLDKPAQELFENNALVLIDFDKAIANGYVKLCTDIREILSEDYEDGTI